MSLYLVILTMLGIFGGVYYLVYLLVTDQINHEEFQLKDLSGQEVEHDNNSIS